MFDRILAYFSPELIQPSNNWGLIYNIYQHHANNGDKYTKIVITLRKASNYRDGKGLLSDTAV